MKYQTSLLMLVIFSLLAFLSTVGYAQQPLIQITAPANNSLATEGQTITIIVSADPSVQIVGVFSQSPLPDVQATSSASQFTLTIPTTVPAGLYNLTAIGSKLASKKQAGVIQAHIPSHGSPVFSSNKCLQIPDRDRAL